MSFERARKDRFVFRRFVFFFLIDLVNRGEREVSSDGKPTSWIGYRRLLQDIEDSC